MLLTGIALVAVATGIGWLRRPMRAVAWHGGAGAVVSIRYAVAAVVWAAAVTIPVALIVGANL
jgi:hypothetical protein